MRLFSIDVIRCEYETWVNNTIKNIARIAKRCPSKFSLVVNMLKLFLLKMFTITTVTNTTVTITTVTIITVTITTVTITTDNITTVTITKSQTFLDKKCQSEKNVTS